MNNAPARGCATNPLYAVGLSAPLLILSAACAPEAPAPLQDHASPLAARCGEVRRMAAPNQRLTDAVINHDARYVAIASNPYVQVLDTRTDVTTDAGRSIANAKLDISDDGQVLAFDSLVLNPLMIIRPDGTNLLAIPDGFYPKLSGDGAYVFYSRRGTDGIFRYPVPTTPSTFDRSLQSQISTADARPLGASRTGHRVLFAQGHDGFVWDANFGVRRVPRGLDTNGSDAFALSGDGEYVAHWSLTQVDSNQNPIGRTLYRHRVGSNFNQEIGRAASTFGMPAPVISDDGRFVVGFSDTRYDPRARRGDNVYVFDAESGEVTYVPIPVNHRSNVAISGDGRTIGVMTEAAVTPEDDDDRGDLYLVANPVECPAQRGAAWFDARFSAPTCGAVDAVCQSGLLLSARVNFRREPNAPNTVDRCADGAFAPPRSPASIEALEVRSVAGAEFAAGVRVNVEARVTGRGRHDFVDLFYAPDATQPDWRHISSTPITGDGQITVRSQLVLHDGESKQAIRAQWRTVGGSQIADACVTDWYADRDDLVFTVARTIPTSWQNPNNRLDVNDDGHVTAIDALLVINELNNRGTRPLPTPTVAVRPAPYYDVNGDRFLSAIDALYVINHLNR